MYPVSQEFQEKILAPERRVLGKVEIEYMKKTEEFAYNDPCLTYTGNWAFDQEEGGEGTWGLPVYYATEEGASVEFEFFGTEVHIKTFTWMQDRGIVHCYIDGFQFLIGTLKTILLYEEFQIGRGFQFLIGTLKTDICQAYLDSLKNVSIPHRYAKNRQRS